HARPAHGWEGAAAGQVARPEQRPAAAAHYSSRSPLYWNLMTRRPLIPLTLGCGFMVCAMFAQKPFRQYPAWEQYELPLPPDYSKSGEWAFARLMYPTTHLQMDW